jgi:hypothetical protein
VHAVEPKPVVLQGPLPVRGFGSGNRTHVNHLYIIL